MSTIFDIALDYIQREFKDYGTYFVGKYKNKRDGVKYCNISDTLEQCPFYGNNKPRPFYLGIRNILLAGVILTIVIMIMKVMIGFGLISIIVYMIVNLKKKEEN